MVLLRALAGWLRTVSERIMVRLEAGVERERAPEKEPVLAGGSLEDWVARAAGSGPPAHWVARVRESAPQLLDPDYPAVNVRGQMSRAAAFSAIPPKESSPADGVEQTVYVAPAVENRENAHQHTNSAPTAPLETTLQAHIAPTTPPETAPKASAGPQRPDGTRSRPLPVLRPVMTPLTQDPVQTPELPLQQRQVRASPIGTRPLPQPDSLQAPLRRDSVEKAVLPPAPTVRPTALPPQPPTPQRAASRPEISQAEHAARIVLDPEPELNDAPPFRATLAPQQSTETTTTPSETRVEPDTAHRSETRSRQATQVSTLHKLWAMLLPVERPPVPNRPTPDQSLESPARRTNLPPPARSPDFGELGPSQRVEHELERFTGTPEPDRWAPLPEDALGVERPSETDDWQETWRREQERLVRLEREQRGLTWNASHS